MNINTTKRCLETCIRDLWYDGEFDQLVIIARQAPYDERSFYTTVGLLGDRHGASYVCEYHVPTLLLAEIINVRV